MANSRRLDPQKLQRMNDVHHEHVALTFIAPGLTRALHAMAHMVGIDRRPDERLAALTERILDKLDAASIVHVLRRNADGEDAP